MENTLEIEKKAKKAKNYSEDDVQKLLASYAEHGTAGIETVAQEMNKPIRSVRSKLVNLGAYVPIEKPAKAKKQGPLKSELIAELSTLTGSKHEGLDPASKPAIEELITIFQSLDKSPD